jgi:hypothetical protein
MNPIKLAQRVKDIVGRYNLLLKYMVLGPQSLTKAQIKTLVKAGMIKAHHIQMTLGDAYLQGHMGVLRGASRRSVRDSAIKFLMSSAGQFIDKFAESQSAGISSIIQTQLMAYVQQSRDTVKEELVEGVLRSKSSSAIVQAIKDKTQDYAKDWDRVVTTELVRAHNLGALDAIIENNIGTSHDDVYVYKVGPNDSKTCKHCFEFWFTPEGNPKVYKLSDIVGNGSNIGRKQKDWQATCDVTHPNCRHFLNELQKGFGFKGGSLHFISKDHNEYWHQRNRGF